MNCSNCGQLNDNESNFCKNCGYDLKMNRAVNRMNPADPDFSIFDNYSQPLKKSTTDLGYLIISLIILTNIFLWFAWSFFGNSISNEYRTGIKVLQVLGSFFLVTEFIVMLVFTKRSSYRIVIGIIGGIVAISQIVSLIRTLTYLD